MKVSGKSLGAVLGTAVLVSGAAVAPAFASVAESPDATAAQPSVVKQVVGSEAAVLANPVMGTFSFSQEALTPTSVISGVFSRAAAALCVSPSYYATSVSSGQIAVEYNGAVIEATVDELADDEASVSDIIGCACSSNAPGGGAIVNAEVSGASIALLVALANAC